MKVIVARHTQTDLNKEKRYSGQLDVPLNHEGVLQAQALVHLLKDENIAYAYSSDLIRGKQTARIVVGNRNCDISQSYLLREFDAGVAAGMTREDAVRVYRDDRLDTHHKDCDFTSVGGENQIAGILRYHQFFERLNEEKYAKTYGCHPDPDEPKDETGLVIVHGTAWRYYSKRNPKLSGVKKIEQGDFLILELNQLS